MKREATVSRGRVVAIVVVTLLAGVQIALYLADFYDDGVASIPSLLIGVAILIVAAVIAIRPFVDR